MAADEEKPAVQQDEAAIIRRKVEALLEEDRARAQKAPPKGASREEELLTELAKLSEVGAEIALPDHCEDDIALFFSDLHGESRVFVAQWGKWLFWNNRHWQFDETLSTYDLMRKCVRERAKTLGNDRVAAAVASARTVAGAERLVRSDRRHAATPQDFDADPMQLNTPGGTVDLATGAIREFDRADMITKMTAVAPDHEADDSAWIRFLDEVTCGSGDLQAYLQRLFGLALTGDTRDHILPFFIGSGANGKSTLLDLMLYIFGDYARQVPSEILMEARGERHPTEVANLAGVRLAIASEVDEGQAWAESRLKALTGDEMISARFMRQDFFTFRRTHKLIVAGNHRPALRAVDEAIRRRIHLIPFDARFIGDKADRDMPAKLRAEAPAILAWTIRGALDWRAHGLCPPAVVTGATDDYLASQDTLGMWIEEQCDVSDQAAETRSRELYKAFHAWKERRGERPPSEVRFSGQLEQRFRKERRGGVVRFAGIQLREPELREQAGQDG
jgi:putative DNA primase/helicase